MPIKKDVILNASDGDKYRFLGQRWRNLRTGRMATSAIEMELEALAIREGLVYGDSVFEDLFNSAISMGFGDERQRVAREWVLEKNFATRKWARDESANINRSGAQLRSSMFDISTFKNVNRPLAGKMYCYMYDAKLKEKLPYWDYFPVIFGIGDSKDDPRDWYGINLHYLDFRWRVKLMDALYTLRSPKPSKDNTILAGLNYDFLKGNSKFKAFLPCLHRYKGVGSFVKSRILEIPPNYWSIISFLPMQRFMKANSRTVWKDSNAKIK